MTVYVVVMTGHNVANLSPLINAWMQGDRVLLLPTSVCPDERVRQFEAALQAHGLHGVERLRPLDPHPMQVADWCTQHRAVLLGGKQANGQIGGADSLCLVGNGGTKPMQDMLRVGLAAVQGGSPVATLYAQAQPVRLLRLQDGAAALCESWKEGLHRQVQLHDVLNVAGHEVLAGTLLWSSARSTQPASAVPHPHLPDMACFAQPVLHGQPSQPPAQMLAALRHQVASAVLALLSPGSPLAGVAAELWLDVHAGVPDEHDPRAHWDVLLLLRNGILVHLDCSAWWRATPADSTHEAMRALIDRTGWCLPLPPVTGSGSTLAHTCHVALRRHGQLGRRALPWLWPGQTVPIGKQCLRDGAFETALAQLLADYTGF